MRIAELKSHPTTPVETRWRRIVTSIPAPESLALLAQLRELEPRSLHGLPSVLWNEAEDFLVRDAYGNQWIDFTSGIVVANSGHANPNIVNAIHRQLDRKLLFTYTFASKPRIELLSELIRISPIPDAKAILFSAGTEATECAIALMRRYGRQQLGTKSGIIGFEWGYHGRTLGASMTGGASNGNDWIDRCSLHNYLIPFPAGDKAQTFESCIASLQNRGITPDHIAGIIAEPMQGWLVELMPRPFAESMFAWARRHDVLIAFDEIQVGCGRTGKFFASEHIGVTPDLICLGKGLSSSLPVSAVLGRREIMDLAEPGEMSSTHGGNPVCAAAALANLREIHNQHLTERARSTGRIIRPYLERLQYEFPDWVESVAGIGLIYAIHLKRKDGRPNVELADAIAHEAVRRGVMMCVTGRGYLKIVPPLTIPVEAAKEAIDVIGEVMRDMIATTTPCATNPRIPSVPNALPTHDTSAFA